jgi:hypothetical protein
VSNSDLAPIYISVKTAKSGKSVILRGFSLTKTGPRLWQDCGGANQSSLQSWPDLAQTWPRKTRINRQFLQTWQFFAANEIRHAL